MWPHSGRTVVALVAGTTSMYQLQIYGDNHFMQSWHVKRQRCMWSHLYGFGGRNVWDDSIIVMWFIYLHELVILRCFNNISCIVNSCCYRVVQPCFSCRKMLIVRLWGEITVCVHCSACRLNMISWRGSMKQRNLEPRNWRLAYKKPLKSCHSFELLLLTGRKRKNNWQKNMNSLPKMQMYVCFAGNYWALVL